MPRGCQTSPDKIIKRTMKLMRFKHANINNLDDKWLIIHELLI